MTATLRQLAPKPTPGADDGVWGDLINEAHDRLDAATVTATTNLPDVVGDGVHDDTDGLRAALAGGGVLWVPPDADHFISGTLTVDTPGSWLLTPALVSGKITMANTTNDPAIVFDGVVGVPSGIRHVEVRRQPAGSLEILNRCVDVVDSNGVVIEDLWVNGFAYGVHFAGCGDCVVRLSEIEACAQDGIHVTNSDAIGLVANRTYRCGRGVRFKTGRGLNGTTQRQLPCKVLGHSDTESVTNAWVVDDYVDVLISDFDSGVGIGIDGGVAYQSETAGLITGASKRITVNQFKSSHARLCGLQVAGTADVININDPDISGVGDFPAVPGQGLYSIRVERTCGRVTIKGGSSSDLLGHGVYHGASGRVLDHDVYDFGRYNSDTQGRIGINVDPGAAGHPVRVRGCAARIAGTVRGTGFQASSGTGHVFEGNDVENCVTPFANTTGGHVQLWNNSWGSDDYAHDGALKLFGRNASYGAADSGGVAGWRALIIQNDP